jgi:hypothetical protein
MLQIHGLTVGDGYGHTVQQRHTRYDMQHGSDDSAHKMLENEDKKTTWET